jgi:hypothetical protein
LVVRNAGKSLHELVIGTKAELDAHAALMAKFPDMAHSEPYMTHVKPGRTDQLIWTFNRGGEFEFACLLPGHYQAGMVGKIKVSAPITPKPRGSHHEPSTSVNPRLRAAESCAPGQPSHHPKRRAATAGGLEDRQLRLLQRLGQARSGSRLSGQDP